MITAIDDWVPPAGRETVRALAREIDDTIGGFVRGQSALCLILAVFYAAALHLIRAGTKYADALCEPAVDWVHPLCRLALGLSGFNLHRNCAVLARLDLYFARAGRLFYRAIARGLCAGALLGQSARSS